MSGHPAAAAGGTWLLCDYGNVLSIDQPEAERLALASEAGLSEAAFAAAYWRHRDPYDRGMLTAAEFWSQVCGTHLGPDRLARLVRLDVASWTHPRTASIEALARARRRGLRTALLSNAPIEIARAVEHLPWLGGVAPRLFSCDLGTAKPDRPAFVAALEAIGADPGEVVFVDDRADNVAAAAALGIATTLFRDPSQLDELGPRAPS